MDYKQNQKFFGISSSGCGIKLAWLGMIAILTLWLIIAAAAESFGFALFGIIAFVIFAYFLRRKGRVSYVVIQKCCEKMIAKARQEGMQHLGIDESEVGLIEPMVIHGFEYLDKEGHLRINDEIISAAVWKEVTLSNGKKITFSPVYSISVIFFSEHVVQRYEHVFSLVSNNEIKGTDEYFYNDIVSVTTVTESGKRIENLEEVFHKYDTLVISTAGGRARCSATNSLQIQDQINGFRSLLKQKKMATA